MSIIDNNASKGMPSLTTSFGTSKSMMPKVLLVTLCTDHLIKTTGSGTYTDDVFELPALNNLGPMVKRIRVHLNVESATTNFRSRVGFAWSMLGRVWSTPSNLIVDVVGDTTSTIGTWFEDETKFGLHLRASGGASNNSGSAIESGRVTAILEIELKS